MVKFWARIKQVWSWLWIPVSALGALLLVALLWSFSRKRAAQLSTEVVTTARTELAIANTQAAIAVAAAHHEDAAVAAELASIAKDEDTKRRLARLVALRERIK